MVIHSAGALQDSGFQEGGTFELEDSYSPFSLEDGPDNLITVSD